MKLSNTMVSAILIGAALVSAYGIGLLIRQVRTGAPPTAPVAAEANEVAARSARMGPGAAPAKDTPEQRAQIKDKREKMLEKMSAATKEEQEQYREKVIKQVGGRRGGKGPGGLSPEERQARKRKAQVPSQAGSEAPDANTPPATPKESTNAK